MNRSQKKAHNWKSLVELKLTILLVATIWQAFAAPAFCEDQAASKTKPLSPEAIQFFESKVRPLLIDHCLECHGDDPDDIQGGLDLSSRAGLMLGGDSGPFAEVSNNANLLLKAVRYEDLEMPPQGKLADHQIKIFLQWAERGFPDPRTEAAAKVQRREIDIDEGRKFWAFQPPKVPAIPEIDKSEWPRGSIDKFIYRGYQNLGLAPVRDATRQRLGRRIYLTLIGLPPTPSQLDAFINDPQDDDGAIASLVDQLLDSVHFGERWGRHWLDVARYAESSGGGRSLMFRNAWRYRDYVIRAFNNDKPLNEFILQQIAGDLLLQEIDSPSQEAIVDHLVATGFLVLGPTNYEQQDKALLRMEVIDEQIDTMGRAFLGMSLGCARCHDHKFDPIPTKDYYALAGIFGSTQTLVFGNVSGFVKAPLPPNKEEAKELAAYKAETALLQGSLDQLTARVEALGHAELLSKENRRSRVAKEQNGSRSIERKRLAGIVIDNRQAAVKGSWVESTSEPGFVDDCYIHDAAQAKGAKSVTFSTTLDPGKYEVRVSYTPGSNRSDAVPIHVMASGQKSTVIIDQKQSPKFGAFVSLGSFEFDGSAEVVIDTTDTRGVVIADSVQFLADGLQVAADSTRLAMPDNSTATKSEGPEESKAQQAAEALKERRFAEAMKLAEEADQLAAKIKDRKSKTPGKDRFAMSIKDIEKPTDGPLHIRGEIRNLGPTVPRGFLQVAAFSDSGASIPEGQSGRLQLARWIADERNPLTARVYVNRVWQHLFGRGLVGTVDNHGQMGQRPSHPELLDYLAVQFVENDWSTKRLIREIMTSRVYRLDSIEHATNRASDPENRMLWRAQRRRLDAEVIRDTMLMLSGTLDLSVGGLTINKFSQYDWGYNFSGFNRRSVYVPLFRNALLEILEVFDFTNPNLVTGKRTPSTLPTQALYLLNSSFVREQAEGMAKRLIDEGSVDLKTQVEQSHRWIFGRQPNESELAVSIEYLQSFIEEDSAEVSNDAWASLLHMWLASVDFRYLD